MSFEFVDRRSANPGRFKVTAADGSTYYVTLERADGATVAGTPLNAATFNALFRELRGYAEARNLLDNSNFAHPVNQRGGDLYSGAAAYTIDRWKATAMLDVGLADGYLTLSCSDSAAERNGFAQYFGEEKTPEPGTVVTAAYEDLNGNVYAYSGTMPQTGNIALGSTTGIGFRLYSAAEGVRIALMIPVGESIDVKWIAVYEGEYTVDTLPAYRPKDYSAELMECMRYYQLCSTGMVKAVDLRPTMRAKPTVTEVDGGFAYSAELGE